MKIENKETKEVIGEVQNIRKDRKGIQIEEIWYQSRFNLIPESINKGDVVLIKYSTKGDFNNVVLIEKQNEIKKIETKISDTTLNTLLLCIKDIHISNKTSLKEITKQILESYKQIKESLN